jgi:hypothetical protein
VIYYVDYASGEIMSGALIFKILRGILLYPEEFLDLRGLMIYFISRSIMPLKFWEWVCEFILQIIQGVSI